MAKTRKSKATKTAQRAASKSPSKPSVKAAVTQGSKTRTVATEKATPIDAPARQTKKGSMITLLQRPDGATIDDLIIATGWQSHSVRAALTGLRKQGTELVRIRNDAGVTQYRICGQP